MKKEKKTPAHLGQKIGIIGGGQLARMMAIEGAKLGFEIHILSENSNDPAAQVVRHWHEGDPNNPESLMAFFSKVQQVTFESEFLNQESILKALSQINSKAEVHLSPPLSIIGILSDRLSQKKWLQQNRIPTSPFVGFEGDNKEIQNDQLIAFFNKSKNGIVLKKRRFGYDGYGTFIIRTKAMLRNWLRENEASLSDYIAEEYIAFKRELATQIAASSSGSILRFPTVEWLAKNSKCLWVKGPVISLGVNQIAPKIVHALKISKYIGLVAFEFFESDRGILVNEVAPRVHNSGHYTLEAATPNQFSAHLLAITGHDLPPTPNMTASGFAMLNLLGDKIEKASGEIPLQNGTFLHWYGKSDSRPGRKMGHLTALDKTSAKALHRLLKI